MKINDVEFAYTHKNLIFQQIIQQFKLLPMSEAK